MIHDVLLWVFGLLTIAIAFGAFIIVTGMLNDTVQELDMAPDEYKTILEEQTASWPVALDYAFLALYAGFILGMISISWYLDTNPLFFIAFILMIFVCGIIAGYLSNVFYDVSSDGFLSATFAQMPILSYILNNYIIFAVAPILLMSVVYFAKPSGGGL